MLQQEIERFNKLINVVITSLKILKKAIAGFVVMNEEMEAMYMNCINSKVKFLISNTVDVVHIVEIYHKVLT